MRLFCLMSLLVGLAACFGPQLPAEPEPEPEPVPLFEPDNPAPWCGYATRLVLNPETEAAQKASVESLARQRGCDI
ncbi:hypothetical protein [Tateyamaria sp. ANG-S1]|uniref:hypothetical protein n=1 Tax=Tateyamaria sp. ANG-S1 TaxID=1577905 RepID=UPI00187C9B71|nr:hypothetical protein [Tateyamaria sp. ANG-S1]